MLTPTGSILAISKNKIQITQTSPQVALSTEYQTYPGGTPTAIVDTLLALCTQGIHIQDSANRTPEIFTGNCISTKHDNFLPLLEIIP